MNAERFETLAGAYGGDIARWPEAEREAGLAWRDAHPEARALLAEASELDDLLGTAPAFKPDLILRQRVITSFPQRPVLTRPRTWISGAALAAACAAGIFIGVNFSDSLLADPVSDTAVQTATAFDGSSYFSTESAG